MTRQIITILLAASLSATVAAGQQAAPAPRLYNVFLASDEVMPSASRRALPDLPATESLPADREEIDVEVVIDQKGVLRHARVAQPDPARATRERAVLEAIQKWEFRPAATGDGRPRTSLAIVRFTIERPARAGDKPRIRERFVPPSREPLDARTLPAEIYESAGSGRPRGLTNPGVIRGINPSYDSSAMRAKIQGEVTLDIVILPDGTVGEARVTKSLHEGLDREALIAARHWFFEPATLDGRPVACRTTLLLDFRMR